MKASEFLQKWCDENGGNGKDWKDVVSTVAADDVFNFNAVQFSYRPFDTKYIVYTGRRGIVGSPRWSVSKLFLLSQDSTWRYGTERLLWAYEDKPNALLDEECFMTLANMEYCHFDKQWLCDFNMFRVAFGMMSIDNRHIAVADKARKIEDYDPYARPAGFSICGEGWVDTLEFIGNIEDKTNSYL